MSSRSPRRCSPPRRSCANRRWGASDYDLLDNAGRESARSILPAFQHPRVGDWSSARVIRTVGADTDIEAAVGNERDLQAICFATADAAEGRAAFRERRPGVFRGDDRCEAAATAARARCARSPSAPA